jgi:hypothetical protein
MGSLGTLRVPSPVLAKYFIVGHLIIGFVAQVSLRLVAESQDRCLVPVFRSAMPAKINGKAVRKLFAAIADGHVGPDSNLKWQKPRYPVKDVGAILFGGSLTERRPHLFQLFQKSIKLG